MYIKKRREKFKRDDNKAANLRMAVDDEDDERRFLVRLAAVSAPPEAQNSRKRNKLVTVILFSTCPNPARSCAPLKAKDTN